MRRARLLLLAIGATMVLASPVVAAQPVMEKIQINDIGIVDEFLTEACGFEVLVDVTGHVTFRAWLDADENPIRELNNFAVKARFYTDAASFRTVDVGIDRVTHNADGSILLVVIGNIQPIHLPGQGRVYSDVGRTVTLLTFPDPEGEPVVEILHQSGQHDEEFPVDIVCDFLAG
jgi:hypothetical protein